MISHTCSLSYLHNSWKVFSSLFPRLIKQVWKGEDFSNRFHLFFYPSLTSDRNRSSSSHQRQGLAVFIQCQKRLSAIYGGAKQRSVIVGEDGEGRADEWEHGLYMSGRRREGVRVQKVSREVMKKTGSNRGRGGGKTWEWGEGRMKV